MLKGLSFALIFGDSPENSLSSSSEVYIKAGSTNYSSTSLCMFCFSWKYLKRQQIENARRMTPIPKKIPKRAHLTRIPVTRAPIAEFTYASVHLDSLFTKRRGINFPQPLSFSYRVKSLSFHTWKLQKILSAAIKQTPLIFSKPKYVSSAS